MLFSFKTRLVPLVHHMGGSIRKDMTARVTHLIANVSGGDKYQYATTFRVPVMNLEWVYASWERRQDITFSATLDSFVVSNFLLNFIIHFKNLLIQVTLTVLKCFFCNDGIRSFIIDGC